MEQSKFYQIKNITEHEYTLVGCDGSVITRTIQDVDKSASAFTIQDAKDGDVLATYNERPFIYKGCTDPNHPDSPVAYCGINTNEYFIIDENVNYWWTEEEVYPATKEQRDQLFQKMKEEGYEWDTDKKELKKIEQSNEESNEGNCEIDGLYCAKTILEKTLGKVEGYQTDDGILEHKSAINAVTKLCEQKSVEIKDAVEWLSYCNKKTMCSS